MSNRGRLLSDEELRAEYLRMFRGGLEPLAKALGSQEEHFDELVKALAKGASVIANTQKRLYAEMVVGEDDTKPSGIIANSTARNQLRAEQRARIK